MIQVELMIKGTPSIFGVMVRRIEWKLLQQTEGRRTFIDIYKSPQGAPYYQYESHGSLDENVVTIYFRPITGDDDDDWGGEIIGHKMPDGTKLTVSAKPEKWPLLSETWDLIHQELEKDGLLLGEAIQENGTKKPGGPDPKPPNEDQDHDLNDLEKFVIDAYKFQIENMLPTRDEDIAIRVLELGKASPRSKSTYSIRQINRVRNRLRTIGHKV